MLVRINEKREKSLRNTFDIRSYTVRCGYAIGSAVEIYFLKKIIKIRRTIVLTRLEPKLQRPSTERNTIIFSEEFSRLAVVRIVYRK